ncbi:UNVERIFIED_CONTAM: hypothetical protein FKN15_070910 [Acipenser sinensis]
MDYAMKSLSLFSPKSLSKCVSASASMTQQLLTGPATRPKPFRVANFNRSIKKGIMADGLRDLLNKLPDALHVSSVCSLVLEEDGTMVDTEEFFQTLDDNTVFVVLDKGQEWTPSDRRIQERRPAEYLCVCAEANSRDLGFCFKWKEALRWTLFSMQATGHVLLGTSCYMQQLLDEEEQRAEQKEQLTQPTQLQSILWGKTTV